MYCIVDQGVTVETAKTGDGVVGVVTDATVIKQEIKTILYVVVSGLCTVCPVCLS